MNAKNTAFRSIWREFTHFWVYNFQASKYISVKRWQIIIFWKLMAPTLHWPTSNSPMRPTKPTHNPLNLTLSPLHVLHYTNHIFLKAHNPHYQLTQWPFTHSYATSCMSYNVWAHLTWESLTFWVLHYCTTSSLDVFSNWMVQCAL